MWTQEKGAFRESAILIHDKILTQIQEEVSRI